MVITNILTLYFLPVTSPLPSKSSQGQTPEPFTLLLELWASCASTGSRLHSCRWLVLNQLLHATSSPHSKPCYDSSALIPCSTWTSAWWCRCNEKHGPIVCTPYGPPPGNQHTSHPANVCSTHTELRLAYQSTKTAPGIIKQISCNITLNLHQHTRFYDQIRALFVFAAPSPC